MAAFAIASGSGPRSGAALRQLAPPSTSQAAVALRLANGSQGEGLTSFGMFAGVAAAILTVRFVSRRSSAQKQRRRIAISRKAEDIEIGYEDPKTGEKNYVNPWEERVELPEDFDPASAPVPSGLKFHPYTGPVYKKVPVVEGLSFPLDPKIYAEPLEPPPPGAKWGDGRSPDGNWYMKVNGEKVQYWQAVGRRKTAVAIVKLLKGNGQFIINGREAIEYFNNNPIWWIKACEPIAAMSLKNNHDILCKSFGGGLSGQAGAIRLGVARRLQEMDFNLRPLLKKSKYLTRDARRVESKKTGKPKARKDVPYHKR